MPAEVSWAFGQRERIESVCSGFRMRVVTDQDLDRRKGTIKHESLPLAPMRRIGCVAILRSLITQVIDRKER